jgi:phage terminase Nu1 subunit (DNA packaging protein)
MTVAEQRRCVNGSFLREKECGTQRPEASIFNEINKGGTVAISGPDLAGLLGVGESTIRALAGEGRLVKLARGRFDRDASVRRYCEHLRAVAAGRGGPSGVESLTAERARLAREQADGHALKNAVSRGELLPAERVTATWRATLADVRARMLAVPSRVGARLGHLTRDDVAAIEAEVRDALREAANG